MYAADNSDEVTLGKVSGIVWPAPAAAHMRFMTNKLSIIRVQPGVPTGGEFASRVRAEAAFELAIADEVNAWDYQETANDQSTSPERLLELVELDDWLLSTWVAKNPSTGPEALTILAASVDNSIRQLAAGHPNTSKSDLTDLSYDRLRDVRTSAAANPSLPASAQNDIAKNERERGVQLALATNPGATPEALTLLAASQFEVVRAAVAKL